MITERSNSNRFWVSLCALLIILMIACGKSTTVSQSEVNARIETQIPPGTSLREVQEFLDSLEIRGRKPSYLLFRDERPHSTDKKAFDNSNVVGYLDAVINNTGREPSKFLVYRIE